MDPYLKYYEKAHTNIPAQDSSHDTPPLKVNYDYGDGGKRQITRNDLYAHPLLFYYEAQDIKVAPIGHDWIQLSEDKQNPDDEQQNSDNSDDSEDEEPSIPHAYKNRPGRIHLSPGIIIAENFPPLDANTNLMAKELRNYSREYKWEFFYTNFLLYLLEFVKCHRHYMLVVQELSLQERKYIEYIITCLGTEEYNSILDFENCWQVNILFYIRMYNCYALRIKYGSESLLSIIKTAPAWTYVVLPENLNKNDRDLITRDPPPKIALPLRSLLVRPYEINPLLNPNVFYNIIVDPNARNLKYLRLKLMDRSAVNANIVKCCLLNLNLINLSIIDVTIEVLSDVPHVPNILVPILIVPAKQMPVNPVMVPRLLNELRNPSLLNADAKKTTSSKLNPNANPFVCNIPANIKPVTPNVIQPNLIKAASKSDITRHFNAPNALTNNVSNMYPQNGLRPGFNVNNAPNALTNNVSNMYPQNGLRPGFNVNNAPNALTNNVSNMYSQNGLRPGFNVNTRPLMNPNSIRYPRDPNLFRFNLNNHNQNSHMCPVHFNTRPQVLCPNVVRPHIMDFNRHPHNTHSYHMAACFPRTHIIPQTRTSNPNIGVPPPMALPAVNRNYLPPNYGMLPPRTSYYTPNPYFQSNSIVRAERPLMNLSNPIPPSNRPLNVNHRFNLMMPPGRPLINPPTSIPPTIHPLNLTHPPNSMVPPNRPSMNPPTSMRFIHPFNSNNPPNSRFLSVQQHTTPINQPNQIRSTIRPLDATYQSNSTMANSNTTKRTPVMNAYATNFQNSIQPGNATSSPSTNQNTKSQQPNSSIPSLNPVSPSLTTRAIVNENCTYRPPNDGIAQKNLPMVVDKIDKVKPILVNPDVLSFLTMNSNVMDPMSTNCNKMGLTVVKSDIKSNLPETKSSQSETPDASTTMSVDLMSPPTTLSSIISPSTTDTNEFSPAISDAASVSPASRGMNITNGVSHAIKGISTAKKEESKKKQANLVAKKAVALEVSTIAEKRSSALIGRGIIAKKNCLNEEGVASKVTGPINATCAVNGTNLVSIMSSLNTKDADVKVDDANATLKEISPETFEFKGSNFKEEIDVLKKEKPASKASNEISSDFKNSPSMLKETSLASNNLNFASKEASSTENGVDIKIKKILKSKQQNLGLNIEREPKWSPILNVTFDENYFKGKRKKYGTKYNEKVIKIVQSFLRFALNDSYTEFMFLGPFEAKESEAICIFLSLYVRNTMLYGDMYKDLEYLLNSHRRDAKECYTVTDRVDLNYVIYKHKM